MRECVKSLSLLVALVWTLPILTLRAADKDVDSTSRQTPWGTIVTTPRQPDRLELHVTDRPSQGILELPAPVPNVIQAYFAADRSQKPLPIRWTAEAGRVMVHLPPLVAETTQRVIVVETADKSQQLPDGRIVFVALDAQFSGKTTRRKNPSVDPRVGNWVEADDSPSWKFRATRPGRYVVELTYALSGGEGTEFTVATNDAERHGKLSDTKSWSIFSTMPVGTLAIVKPGDQTVALRCTKQIGPAVMNLKALTFRPVTEGNPIRQSADGSTTLHARDVTIQGVQVQYEPKPEKNTIGFWTNPSDQVSWDFELKTPGRFSVEILQACGKDQGGSEVALSIAGETLRFTVEDTGHFQNFVPREIGTVTLEQPGTYTLNVTPLRKAGVAVMDLRQVRLVPVRVAN